MPMREARVIALAGVFQGCRLVLDLATNGKADAASSEASLASIFRIDSDSAADVFGGISGVRLGFDELIAQLDHGAREVNLTGVMHTSVQTRLAELYCETLSHVRPRVMVHGNPVHLGNPRDVEQIRAMLLAAVRAAVLWHQVGGGQFRLLIRRTEYAMLARGLLARCTLDRG